jgi:ATP-binding cassette subfamily B multidrug efflux pump
MKAGMATDTRTTPQPEAKATLKPEDKPKQGDEEVLGKAYDGRLMRRLLTYLRPYKLQAGLSIGAILIKAGADIMGPYLTKVAIDTYMSAHRPEHPSFLAKHLSPRPGTGVTELAGIYMGLLTLSYLLEFVQTYLMQWTGQKIMFDMRSQIFRHLQRMDIGFFDRNPVGRLVTRLTSDVDALNEMFTSGVFAIFEDVFVLLGIVLVMFQMSWWLALVTLSVIPVILLITRVFRKHVRDSYRRIRTAIARINAFTQEHVTGMTVVQLFNREDRAYDDFKAINNQHMVAFKDAILAYALYYPAVELLSSVAIALVIWVGGAGVIRNTLTIGILVAFIQYAQRFFRPIQDLSDKYNILQAAMAASERVFKLVDTEPEIYSPESVEIRASAVPAEIAGRVEFRNVWFTYQRLTDDQQSVIARGNAAELIALSSEIEWILKGVSFTIEPNQTAAIVGHTGAGKTTIISLMMRFYDVQHGQVLIDDVDVRRHDLTKLRQHFGVVLQDPFLFTGTIAENIRLGSEWITDTQLKDAAEQVNLADFIATLPHGYNEALRERGAGLSTGQKQLINFARALAHAPRILILDEATSSVDTETELRVRSALDRLVTGRTSVLIAHRLSTVQRADVILVMHKGQLRESGSHQELLTKRGLYWKLYQLQYKDQEVLAARASTPVSENGLLPLVALSDKP